MEDMCFKKVFDSALKSAIRFNHSLDEVLDHADVKDKWAKCQETAEEDAKATAVALRRGPAAAGGVIGPGSRGLATLFGQQGCH